MHLLIGLLYLVVGVLIIEKPGRAILDLTLLLAAFFLVGGLFRIVLSLVEQFHGWGWVSENDDEVIKIEVEAKNDVLLGWGILGRVKKGSRLTWERRKVNGEVWLPARTKVEVMGRTLLVRTFSVEAVTEFSDYMKFDVTTNETYTPRVN